MAEYIVMPALSPGMTEGKIARWVKAKGDPIRAGEIIAEIETDKATLEFESSETGVLGEILVPAGGTAGVNAPIALLLRDGEGHAPAAPPADRDPGRGLPAAPRNASVVAPGGARDAPRKRKFASPIARRLARELDVDLEAIAGSGPAGRVVRSDVEGAAANVVVRATTEAAPPHGTTAVPNSSMRKVIARRLLEAKQTIPHYYLTIDVELDALLDLRRRFNARASPEGRLTVNDLVVKAAALALRTVPAANATWTDDAILRYDAVDVAVAVATQSGLVTPVVRDADRKSVVAISAELRALSARAHAGRLRPDEYQGGGFTVTNLGMHGIREFAAIINPPQSCILAVGAAEPRAVVRDGAVVARTLMTCTLSADHRTVDGATGAEFLAAFRSNLQDALVLFL